MQEVSKSNYCIESNRLFSPWFDEIGGAEFVVQARQQEFPQEQVVPAVLL